MTLTAEFTTFTLDNLGRGLSNTLDEALYSAGIGVPGFGPPPADARPFDVIIIGGGTFGSVLAQHLLFVDRMRSRRILVLEAGPFVLPEHVQNLPFLGYGLPDFVQPWEPTQPNGPNPTGLRMGLGGRSLEWGGWSPQPLDAELAVDWPAGVVADLQGVVTIDGNPNQPGYFAQAADQLGVEDTNDFIYGPFHNALRVQLRMGLTSVAAGTIAANLSLGTLPNPLAVQALGPGPTAAQLRDLLGLPMGDTTPPAQLLEQAKLEAPLAVQARNLPGLFPINKFSGLPLLIAAERSEADASYPYDQFKRLLVVPGWHVQDIETRTLADNSVQVTGVWVAQGLGGQVTQRRFVPLAEDGVVVIALGTIESSRLALQTFQQSLSWRAAQRMGQNLLAHLRSNFTIRVPRNAIPGMPPIPATAPGAAQQVLTEVSALFVKGRANLQGRDRYFHLQVTASGANAAGRNSEAQLFRKVPDLDQLDRLRQSSNTHVVITLRGIGEMTPHNPDSFVTRDLQALYFDRPRAAVSIGDAQAYAAAAAQSKPPVSPQTQLDADVWERMDQLADEVAVMFANGQPFEILTADGSAIPVPAGATAADLAQLYPHTNRRDSLGSTHHEAGTLRMGDNIAASVTDGFGRIHDTTNCFCASPALYPSLGSPNPMLTGVGLVRRTGDFLSRRLVAQPAATLLLTPTPFGGNGAGWQVLFDGTLASFNAWAFVGSARGADNQPPCGFRYIDGQIVTVGAGDFGLLFYPQAFSNFTLRLQFRVFDATANSGVFVRIRDPRQDLPPPIQARAAADLQTFNNNRAWTAVHSGFEVQIDDTAQGDSRVDFYGIRPEPNGLRKNRTGAIYKIPAGDPIPNTNQLDRQDQDYTPGPLLLPLPWRDPNGWYEYEIRVQGDTYEARLGRVGQPMVQTTRFVNTDLLRGVAPSPQDPATGFIGLQAYSNKRVAFRHIEVQPLP
jgi:choline dehydrogenase-like flavoprotein